MRRIQGAIAIGIGLFAVKWEFYPHKVAPPAPWFFNNDPPWQAWMLYWIMAVLIVFGIYMLVTGEIDTWRVGRSHSSHTSAGLAAAFVGLFGSKWAYNTEPHLMGYYPPFNEDTLGLLVLGLLALAVYYFVRGEIRYWRGGADNPRMQTDAAVNGDGGGEGE